MKSILFLLDRYPAFGGIETVTTVLANSLAEHYHVILCSCHGDEKHELLQRLDPRVSFRLLPNATKQGKEQALDAILTEEKVEVVIYQDSYAPNQHLAHHIRRRGDIKLIVAEHSSPGLSRKWVIQLPHIPKWNLYRLLKLIYGNTKGHVSSLLRRTRLYRACDRYVVLSENLKQEFLENSFVRDSHKLCAIGNPVSYEALPIDLNAKKKQVLFIGQFVGLKGINRLLRIWGKVQAQVPEWSLVLVGDGPKMPWAQGYINKRALQRVELAGYRTNVRDYCAEASIFCLCSLFEGFPMVLPEAMCSGAVPVCFNSFAALSDIITDGVSGCSIPAFDEAAFAARLLQLMQDDDLRRSMAQAALAKSAEFNIPSITARWQALLDEVLQSE